MPSSAVLRKRRRNNLKRKNKIGNNKEQTNKRAKLDTDGAQQSQVVEAAAEPQQPQQEQEHHEQEQKEQQEKAPQVTNNGQLKETKALTKLQRQKAAAYAPPPSTRTIHPKPCPPPPQCKWRRLRASSLSLRLDPTFHKPEGRAENSNISVFVCRYIVRLWNKRRRKRRKGRSAMRCPTMLSRPFFLLERETFRLPKHCPICLSLVCSLKSSLLSC